MKVFYAFLLFCFLAGALSPRMSTRWRVLGLLAVCTVIILAYYFRHLI